MCCNGFIFVVFFMVVGDPISKSEKSKLSSICWLACAFKQVAHNLIMTRRFIIAIHRFTCRTSHDILYKSISQSINQWKPKQSINQSASDVYKIFYLIFNRAQKLDNNDHLAQFHVAMQLAILRQVTILHLVPCSDTACYPQTGNYTWPSSM